MSQNWLPWQRPSAPLDPHLTRFLRHIWAHKNPNGISISSAIFAQITTECPYTLQWDAHWPFKITPTHGGPGPHLIHGSLGPTKSSTQTASRSVQPFLQDSLMWQTNRHTTVLGNNRLHLLRSTAMRPNNNNICIVLWGPDVHRCIFVLLVGQSKDSGQIKKIPLQQS